ncbi:MAG: lamin tail domain-containing protein [Myxococcota bacterium]
MSNVGVRCVSAGALAMLVAACSRPPLGEFCPDVDEGDLVITEIRGPQDGADTRGQWFEVYNATDRDIDLRGLRIEFFDRQGQRQLPDRHILVRAEDLVMQPGAYVTLGHHASNAIPPFVDATIIADYFGNEGSDDDEELQFGVEPDRIPRDLLTAGRIELSSCGVLIDELRYEDLPSSGTLSLDGAFEPNAEANDEPANFCVDARPEPAAEATLQFFGLPGSPQQENLPCSAD